MRMIFVLKSIVTGDETWIHHYEHETKQQNQRRCNLLEKLWAMVLGVQRGALWLNFLNLTRTINSAPYVKTFHKLCWALHDKHPGKKIILQHDHVWPHSTHLKQAPRCYERLLERWTDCQVKCGKCFCHTARCGYIRTKIRMNCVSIVQNNECFPSKLWRIPLTRGQDNRQRPERDQRRTLDA